MSACPHQSERGSFCLVDKPRAGIVPEASAGDYDQVDQRADSKAASGEKPEDTGADLADVKAMDSDHAQEEA